MGLEGELSAKLERAVREAAIRCVGYQAVGNRAHLELLLAVLRAFGSEPGGLVYVEPVLANTTRRPADVLLCHPDVGIVVFEVKGWSLESIERIEAGQFWIRERCGIRLYRPFEQVTRCMFQIRDAVVETLDGARPPLFTAIVVFPNVSRDQWHMRGFDKCVRHKELLLRDELQSPEAFRAAVLNAVGTAPEVVLSPEQLAAVERAFGSSAVLRAARSARPVNRDTLGARIDEFMNNHRVLTREQSEISQITVGHEPRLIRGVAGSGKTTVLAVMAARAIRRMLEVRRQRLFAFAERTSGGPRVLVTCFNRALVGYIRDAIERAYRKEALAHLPAGILEVRHIDGVAWRLAERRLLRWIKVSSERESERRFEYLCAQLQARAANYQGIPDEFLYDLVFVDEAQDFGPAHFRFLLHLIRPHPATGELPIVIFYDDAQNVYGRRRPTWRKLGIDLTGFRSRVMTECFRNSRPIVEFALNLLLGSTLPPRDRPAFRDFADIGYLKRLGAVVEEEDWIHVRFAPREGPPPIVKRYDHPSTSMTAIARRVRYLITEEQVRPEDILVLAHRRTTVYCLREKLRQELGDLVAGFVVPVGDSPDKDHYIFRPDHLTVSTVHGAKGYDAPIVLLEASDFDISRPLNRVAFYVGATRAMVELEVHGVATPFLSEAARVCDRLASTCRAGGNPP